MSADDDESARPVQPKSGSPPGFGVSPASSAKAPSSDDVRGPAAEDALDLDDLERGGVAGVVADMREDDESVSLPRARRRSPALSVVVIAFGMYLLITMWSDFRYWLVPREPVDLGHARALVQEGRLPDDLHNRYVVLQGTPDVQHAARLTTKKRFVGYLRLIEGGGSLFAAIPRSKEEEVTNTFAGRYQGRMVRLGSSPTYPWIEQFFEQEAIVEVLDTSPAALQDALRQPSRPLRIETERGPLTLGANAQVRLVVRQPEVNLQLGKNSFRTRERADEAVAALGVPFTRLDREGGPFHSYVARIPESRRDEVQRQLNEGLDVPDGNADPRVGAFVLPRTATYLVESSNLSLVGEQVHFTYGDNTTSPGYGVQGDQLVERQPREGMVAVPVEALQAVRVELPVRVDPDGYLILAEATPATMLIPGILWLVVAAITGVNVGSLLLWWRRRRNS